MYMFKVCCNFKCSMLNQYDFRVAGTFDYYLKACLQAVLTSNWRLKGVIVDSNAMCRSMTTMATLDIIFGRWRDRNCKTSSKTRTRHHNREKKVGFYRKCIIRNNSPHVACADWCVCVCAVCNVKVQGAKCMCMCMVHVQSAKCKVQSA